MIKNPILLINLHSKFKEKENKSINLNDILTLSQPYHDLKAKIPSTTCNGYITFNLFFRGVGRVVLTNWCCSDRIFL